jgi:hypothetical protein
MINRWSALEKLPKRVSQISTSGTGKNWGNQRRAFQNRTLAPLRTNGAGAIPVECPWLHLASRLLHPKI